MGRMLFPPFLFTFAKKPCPSERKGIYPKCRRCRSSSSGCTNIRNNLNKISASRACRTSPQPAAPRISPSKNDTIKAQLVGAYYRYDTAQADYGAIYAARIRSPLLPILSYLYSVTLGRALSYTIYGQGGSPYGSDTHRQEEVAGGSGRGVGGCVRGRGRGGLEIGRLLPGG